MEKGIGFFSVSLEILVLSKTVLNVRYGRKTFNSVAPRLIELPRRLLAIQVLMLVNGFSSALLRFYYGNDLIGNEIGAASKNVVGIAAGILDGLGLSSLKGALMSRGTREIARLIKAMGGSELSAYGLCHLGDYEATVFSRFSHNRSYGEALARGADYSELAEGHYTADALNTLAAKKRVELPICAAVYRVIYEKKNPAEEVKNLFLRDLKSEF